MRQVHRTAMMRKLEDRLGEPLEVALPRLVNELGTVERAARKLRMKPNTLYVWLRYMGFSRRARFEPDETVTPVPAPSPARVQDAEQGA